MGIRRAQDMPVSYKMVREILTGRIILYLIVLYILQILICIPAALIAGIGVWLAHIQPEPSNAMLAIAVILYLTAFILFIFLTVRMGLAYGTVVDKKLNPWEAIKLSFKATKGNVWNLIGLYCLNVLVIFACAITAGIGLIWGLPWLLIVYGEAYKRLSTRQDMRPVG